MFIIKIFDSIFFSMAWEMFLVNWKVIFTEWSIVIIFHWGLFLILQLFSTTIMLCYMLFADHLQIYISTIMFALLSTKEVLKLFQLKIYNPISGVFEYYFFCDFYDTDSKLRCKKFINYQAHALNETFFFLRLKFTYSYIMMPLFSMSCNYFLHNNN